MIKVMLLEGLEFEIQSRFCIRFCDVLKMLEFSLCHWAFTCGFKDEVSQVGMNSEISDSKESEHKSE